LNPADPSIDSLRALARGVVGDEHLAEDIVQDASLAALEQPPRDTGALGAWLRRSVVRRASNIVRARSRRRAHEENVEQKEALPSPEEIGMGSFMAERITEGPAAEHRIAT
jgi:DNA-directed RNA polymerase specialized sigma24 family protein